MRLTNDRSGLEVLSRDECQTLLGTCTLGRVAVVAHSEPEIFPVNYVMDGPTIVFRTAAGTKLDAAVRTTRVAFEIDAVDADGEHAWSVIVRGRAEEVLRGSERARLATLPLRPWAEGDKDHWVRVHPDTVSGRRVGGPGS